MAKGKSSISRPQGKKDDIRKYLGPGPRLKDAMMVDTFRGQWRIRKWPKRRPGKRHPTSEFWSAWLAENSRNYKKIHWSEQQIANDATRGTQIMPRDLYMMARRGTIGTIVEPNGRYIIPSWAWQKVSNAMDNIGQEPGSILVRHETGWATLLPAAENEVLTSRGPDTWPNWKPVTSIPGIGAGGKTLLKEWSHLVEGNAADIELTGIDQGYRHLYIEALLRTNRTASSGIDRMSVQFGEASYDTSSSYSYKEQYSTSSAFVQSQNLNTATPWLTWTTSANPDEPCCVSTGQIFNYSDDTAWKRWDFHSTSIYPGGAYQSFNYGVYRSTAKNISAIKLTPVGGTLFTGGFIKLYGTND